MTWLAKAHRRFNPLTREWLLVSPHRTQRPWQGQTEATPPATALHHDPTCYLCPGNSRAGGVRNPQYTSTFVFDNDFPAITPTDPAPTLDVSGLIVARAETGVCRVVCYSPDHALSLSGLASSALERIVDCWAEQTVDLGSSADIANVQIFENRGAAMGASNPHPHGQIWASGSLPNEVRKELDSQTDYLRAHGRCLLCDYVELEIARAERIVCRNESFVALVPFWAIWPFETLVLSTRHHGSIGELTQDERGALADILGQITRRYDRVFGVPFPYSMGFHQRPTDGGTHAEWHLHAHFYPPLLRSPTVRKFMVGYEMLGEPQRDITPEFAAARLGELGP